MNIKVGDTVAVKHYSILTPFISNVLGIDDSKIMIRLTKEFSENDLFIGEPIVLGYDSEEKVYVLGCDIETIDQRTNSVVLNVEHEDSFVNLRSRERFPVSLYADLMTSESRNKQLAVIKDLSLFGLRIYTKAELLVGQVAEINIYTEKDVVFIKGKVIRKKINLNYIEYGLGIKYENAKAMNLIESYLKKMKYTYEQQIKKLEFGL